MEWFQEEIGVLILHEHNENIVTDIFKLEELFGIFFPLFICFRLLFCNYEKEVGMELILYVCCWKHWNDYYSKKCSSKQHHEKFRTFSVTNGYEKH